MLPPLLPRAAAGALLLAAAAACAPHARASAQSSAPTATDTVEAEFDDEAILEANLEVSERIYQTPANTLGLATALRGLWDEYAARPRAYRQAVSLELIRVGAELGSYREALEHADHLYGRTLLPPSSAAVPSLEGYEPVDAVEYLARAAARERVVMINEAHHVPQHRAFTRMLLEPLRRHGFGYFAAEAFSERDAELDARGYPIPRSGPYLAEPVFGDLVRSALGLGYRSVPYESRDPNAGREEVQATNLVRRTLERDPGARILVKAGYNHIDESGLLQGAAPMAAQFARMTGIDPLTVDQTVMSERADRALEHPLYGEVVDGRGITRPTVFVRADGTAWSLEPGRRDVTVFHPRSVYRDGRPTWLEMDGARRPHPLPAGVCAGAERCLVRARLEAEAPQGIPVDQVEVVRGEEPPVLLLHPGRYLVETEDAGGTTLSSTSRVVPPR